uniref:Putative sesquiterpene synthase n=1 Tax=Cycas taitungensis TaxID=54799 RepID=A1IGE8_CYCTA|nr:putative sesquiterpene synthase [Cycas taitungensis]
MASHICASPIIMTLDFCSGVKPGSSPTPPTRRKPIRICVPSLSMNSDFGKDTKSKAVSRRTANYHPNLWSSDFIHSLKSPYSECCYRERAETLISEIKGMFDAMGDGEISPSPYDTAWVAKVEAVDGVFRPQFPQALDWILQNQLDDGSWGTPSHFLLSDRLLATLSCVLSLTKWKKGHPQVQRGLEFITNTLRLMNDESQDSLVADLEFIFSSLLNEAKSLELSLPYDLPCMDQLFRKRQERLARISIDSFHSLPSSLLYCLEGLQDIIGWKRIMDVQNKDGSFLSSPAATAFVYMHTGDQKCLAFLNRVLAKFGSCAPCLYPVDLLERLLAVDTVERLGIDRHFERQIKESLDYVYRHWNDESGIACGRESVLPDLETTALGFRLLRLHRYNVSSAVFEKFKEESGLFRCWAGQISHVKEVESMLSLYRASQIAFPGEDVLDEAKSFTTTYLTKALQNSEACRMRNDKQNLGHEVKYALENPWHSSVPRLETKRYCQLYPPDHARLGKSVYMLPLVNNNKYLELAKLDFNILQSVHQQEMKDLTRWFGDSGLRQFPFARQRPIELYFNVCMGTFEPEFYRCRFIFAKVGCLGLIVDDLHDTYGTLDELILFTEAVERWDLSKTDSLPEYMKIWFRVWYDIVDELAREAEEEQGHELMGIFRRVWEGYIGCNLEEAQWLAADYVPTMDAYIKNGITSVGVPIILMYGIFFMGQLLPENILDRPDNPSKIIELVGLICRFTDDAKTFQAEKARGELASSIECYMKENSGSTQDDALNHIRAATSSAVKEMTWEYLKPDDVPYRCKKFVFEVARVWMLMYKDGDPYGISNKEMQDYIREALIEPVPI